MQNKEPPPALLAHPRPIYPWIIWILCNLFNFYMFLLQFSAWDLRSHLMQKNLLVEADMGTLLDPFVLAVIIFQIPIALLLDEFGPRKVTSLMILVAALGVILFGYSSSPFLTWIAILVMGLGATVTYVNTFKLVSNWFLPSRFPFMVGWTIVASIIGAVIGQPLTFLLVKKFGWSNVLFNYGMVGVLLALVFFLCIRDRNYRVLPKPELFRVGASAKKVFKSPQNYAIALAFGLAVAPWLSFTGRWHAPFYAVVYHLSPEKLSFINLIDLITFAIGALFFALYAKKLEKRKILMASGVLGSLVFVCLIFYAPSLGFGGLIVLSGLASFLMSSVTLSYSLIREKKPLSIAGTSIAMVTLSLAVLRFIDDHLITWILTTASGKSVEKIFDYATSDFQLGLTLLPVSLLVSFICIIFIKETYGKQYFGE